MVKIKKAERGKSFAELTQEEVSQIPDHLKDLAKREGFGEFVYKDSLGKDTIGFGHLLTEEEKKSGIVNGIDISNGVSFQDALTLLNQDQEKAAKASEEVLIKSGINPDELSFEQQKAMLNATFQLGPKGVSGFKKMLKAINEGDFKKAAQEAQNSAWYNQTPNRVKDFQKGIQQSVPNNIETIQNRIKGSSEMRKQKKPFIEKISPLSKIDGLKTLLPSVDPLAIKPEFLQANSNTPEEEIRALATATEAQQAAVAEQESVKAQELAAQKQQADESAANLQANIPQNMESAENTGQVSNDVKEALMFFAPQAIGAALGAAFEGTQGAIQGSEDAGNLRDAFNDFKFKKEEIQAKRVQQAKQNFQVMQDFGDLQGRPITFDKTTRRFFDVDGNILSGNNIRNLKNERSSLFADIQKQNLGIRQQQVSQLSDKQVESLASADALDRIVGDIDILAKTVDVGVFSGRIQSALEGIGQASPEFTQMKQNTQNLTAQFTKFLTGAQMTDSEAKRIAQLIPQVNEPETVFKAKLEGFKRYLKNHRTAIEFAIRTGQPLRSDVIKKMVSEAESINAGIASGKRKPLMSDEQRKRLEELRNKYNR